MSSGIHNEPGTKATDVDYILLEIVELMYSLTPPLSFISSTESFIEIYFGAFILLQIMFCYSNRHLNNLRG